MLSGDLLFLSNPVIVFFYTNAIDARLRFFVTNTFFYANDIPRFWFFIENNLRNLVDFSIKKYGSSFFVSSLFFLYFPLVFF